MVMRFHGGAASSSHGSTGKEAGGRSIRGRRVIGVALGVAGSLSIALGASSYVSYRMDGVVLRETAQWIVPVDAAPSEQIVALTSWIHRNLGTRANPSYFIWSRMRATPLQVLAGGGDCADKSRLLWAMLREMGIPATMVMCFDRRTGAPSHTVVDAQVENGGFMAADPAYGLWFPRESGGGFYGMSELRRDPGILDRRLDALLPTAPRRSPIRSYNRESAAYDHATTIHWEKSGLTRAMFVIVRAVAGEGAYRMARPPVVEEPKLFVSASASVLGAVCHFIARRHRRSRWVAEPVSGVEGVMACGR